jgi:hydroxyacylglutathione hydrolase
MNLLALPAFADNYIWMLHDGVRAVVVDPGDAAPVQAALDEARLELAAILVTHRHPDHVGGVNACDPGCAALSTGPRWTRCHSPARP